MNEIAIASVPLQQWEQPVEPARALQAGTIFPSLQKPFFIEEEMQEYAAIPSDPLEARMLEVQQITFALIDLQLYLDMHPEEQEAISRKSELQKKRKELKESFALDYYPLTMDCPGKEKAVMPWEGEKLYVGI